ncbi:MAG: hypothetical protein NT098_05750 [Candidatus Parcubacteria bacterium]|nr:hypothetical protein [Candidatus Parcubacteria bacterium]
MSKCSENSKWDEKWNDEKDNGDKADPTHNSWGQSNTSRGEEMTNHKGDGSKHCHMWNNKEKGDSGVDHRGNCKVCDDEKAEKTWSDSNSTLSIVSRFFGGNG